jgi:hypothetical protein
MADIILTTNVCLCALDDGRSRVYVPNSGRIASISDRTDLRNDPETFESRPQAVQLDSPRVDGEDRRNIGR